MDPWRLATAGMAEGNGSRPRRADEKPPIGDLAVEDLRQSPPQPGRDLSIGAAAGWLGAAATPGSSVDRDRSRCDCIPLALLAHDLAVATAAGSIVACLLHGGGSRCDHQCAAVCAGGGVSSTPGGGISRRDRSHAVQAIDQSQKSSGMADRVAGRARTGCGIAAGNLAEDVAGNRPLSAARSSGWSTGDDGSGRELEPAFSICARDAAVGAVVAGESEHRFRSE